jgi:hypothetical protein
MSPCKRVDAKIPKPFDFGISTITQKDANGLLGLEFKYPHAGVLSLQFGGLGGGGLGVSKSAAETLCSPLPPGAARKPREAGLLELLLELECVALHAEAHPTIR